MPVYRDERLLPASAVQGDSLDVRILLPAPFEDGDEWESGELKLAQIGGDHVLRAEAEIEDGILKARIGAALTAAAPAPASYSATIRATTDGGESGAVLRGIVSLATASRTELPFADRMLPRVELAIESQLDRKGVRRYQLGDREIEGQSLDELYRLRTKLQAEMRGRAGARRAWRT